MCWADAAGLDDWWASDGCPACVAACAGTGCPAAVACAASPVLGSATRPPSSPAASGAPPLRKREASIGVIVSETTPEIRIETAIVTENSRKSRPMIPPMNSSGRNTAESESVIESTVNATSCAPSSAACIASFPISRWRTMFSSTTIASSTTKPTARVSAMSDRLSSE